MKKLLLNKYIYILLIGILFSGNAWGQCTTDNNYTAIAPTPTCNNQTIEIQGPGHRTTVSGFDQNKVYNLYVNTGTTNVNCVQARWQNSGGTAIGGWFPLNYANSGAINYGTFVSPANAARLEITTGKTAWEPISAVLNYRLSPSPSADAEPDQVICPGESVVLSGSATGLSMTATGSSTFSYTGSGRDCDNFRIGGQTSGMPSGATITSIVFDATIGTSCSSWYEWDLIVNNTYISSGCNSTGNVYNGLNGSAANGQTLQLRSWDNDSWCDNVTMTVSFTVNYTYSYVITPTYSWSGGPIVSGETTATPTVNPTVTTTYTLTLIPEGCPTDKTTTVTVNTSATPPTASTGGGNYCHGNNITLTQSGGTDGTGAVNVWYAASGETAPSSSSCDNEGFLELWNDFDYEQNDPSDCYYLNNNTTYSTNNGIVSLQANNEPGGDPFIWMYPLPGSATIDADQYKYVNVRYKVTNYVNAGVGHAPRMAVLFTHRPLPCRTDGTGSGQNDYPFSETHFFPGSVRKTISIDGNWHVVSFAMEESPNWNGTITGLRFDYFDPSPHAGNNGSSMEVDFIIVSKHPMIGEGTSITLSPGDEYYPTETTTYYAKKIDNCGVTTCVSETVVLPPVGTALANNGESATCNVNAGETVHFYNTSSGRYIASVSANATGLGSTTATTHIDNVSPAPNAAPILTNACDDPTFQTVVLGRHWVITPSTNTSATVRLPYYNPELTAMYGPSSTSSNPYDNISSQAQLGLSKYSGPNNVDHLWENNCIPTGGNANTTWQGPNNYGNVADYIAGFPTDRKYSMFNITGFSEFWLHASNVVSPLAVTLSDFNATCEENRTKITWTTASEQNSDYFVLERSRDGLSWEDVSQVDGARTTNTANVYTVSDVLTKGYYRLKQVDFNGATEYFGPIYADCDNNRNDLTVYPNPNSGTFNVVIKSTENLGQSALEIIDLNGKVIESRLVNITNGVNTIYIEDSELKRGTYFISVKTEEERFKPVKLTIY